MRANKCCVIVFGNVFIIGEMEKWVIGKIKRIQKLIQL